MSVPNLLAMGIGPSLCISHEFNQRLVRSFWRSRSTQLLRRVESKGLATLRFGEGLRDGEGFLKGEGCLALTDKLGDGLSKGSGGACCECTRGENQGKGQSRQVCQ